MPSKIVDVVVGKSFVLAMEELLRVSRLMGAQDLALYRSTAYYWHLVGRRETLRVAGFGHDSMNRANAKALRVYAEAAGLVVVP